MSKYNTLTIQPTNTCLRDEKIEKEFQVEITTLLNKYKKYPMLAIQNCYISKEKTDEDILIYLPDKDNYFVLTLNLFKGTKLRKWWKRLILFIIERPKTNKKHE